MNRSWFHHIKVRLPCVLFFFSPYCQGYSDERQQEVVLDGRRSEFLEITPVYLGELLTNARGGKTTQGATQYQGLLDLEFWLDLEKLGVRLPGSLCLLTQNTHGRGLTQDFIGDTQVISNIDSFDNIMQVSERSRGKSLFNNDAA